MPRKLSFSRSLCAVTAASIVLAACTSDDGTAPATTAASEPATTDATAGNEAPADTEPPTGTETTPAPDAPTLDGEGLELGLLEPGPGLLTTLFEGQVRGVDAAVQDIADGGGVLGGPLNVTSTAAPLGGSAADVVRTAIDAGAQVLVGPAGSDDAAQVRTELREAGAIACSASASVPGLAADQEQFGLFRTALPDDVVVSYLADAIMARRDEQAPDAVWKVAIVARSDDYGLSVGNALAASLESRGLDPAVIGYNPQRVLFVGLGAEVTSATPDLTVIVSYEEGAAIVTELTRSGVDPATMVGLDSFLRPRIASIAGPDGDAAAVDGLTMIGTTGNRAFLQRLFTDDDNGQVANSAQAYDCAMILALATEAVAGGSSATMSDAIRDVTAAGVTCTTYADCLDKLRAGDDIDFDGASGRLAIDEAGDPTFGRFTTAAVAGGELSIVETVDVDVAEIRREQAAFAAAAFTTKLQQALTFLGFYDGPIDGLESPELTAALAAFQESVGLPGTGVYDEATDAALRAALGEFGDLLTTSTADLQVLLTELGFYDGPIDGIYSAEVVAAVKALQRQLGVPETGVLDAATIRAAYEQGVIAGGSASEPVPPTTVPPTTAPPTTAPPTTAPPTTAPPTTSPPATAPPATAPPTTEPTPTTIPPDAGLVTLLETLQADPDFSTFVELALLSGFADELDRAQRYTVLAPTNAAFDTLTAEELDALRNDPARLRAALGYHVIVGQLPVAELVDQIETVNGARLEIVGAGADLRVQGAEISKPDLFATNGVIHGLAEFLTPPG